MADQYPQYPQYPGNPQGGAPNQYPYPQPMPGQYPHPPVQQQARKIKNPYATRSLIYGIISIVAVGVVLVTGYIFIGLYSIWAIYYGFRGISYSNKLPGNKGIGMAVTGLVLSIIGTLAMIGVILLGVLATNGTLGQ